MSSNRDLTSGSVAKHLVRLAGPMIFGIVASISVSLIDTYYIGKLGTEPLAAISFTFPVTLAMISLAIGLSAGSASTVSRAVGADDMDQAKRLSTDSLFLSFCLVSIVAIIGYITIDPLFRLLGAEEDILDMAGRYMGIWYLCLPFIAVPMVSNAIVRSVGDAFLPSLIMIGSAILNIAITPIFIFGFGPVPAFDIEGAAIGTLIAYIVSMLAALWLLSIREKMLTKHVPPFKILLRSWKKVLEVGIPAGFGNAVNPVGITVVTAIIATYGTSVVAGFGVATRVESFATIPMLALSSAIGPICGQNWGAGKTDRIAQALKLSYITCFAWAMILSVVFWFAAEPIASIFSSEESVTKTAASYLYIVPVSVWGYGCIIVAAGGYNSIGKPYTGLGYYLIRTALLYIPLSFAASLYFEDEGVYMAIAIANALSGSSVAIYSIWWMKNEADSHGASAGENAEPA